MERLFSRFILDCNLAEKIFWNGVRNVNEMIVDESPEDYVLCLFDWDKTYEGIEYWETIHKEWIEHLRKSGVEVPENYG